MIAFVKDAMIYIFIIAAVVVIPYRARRLRQRSSPRADAAYAAKVAAKRQARRRR